MYGKKMSRRTVLAIELDEELKLGREFPFDLEATAIKRGWTLCGDKSVIVSLLNDQRNAIQEEYIARVINIWQTIKSIEYRESQGEIDDPQKYIKDNLYEQLSLLVGKDNAYNWGNLSNDDRWEAIQDVCEKKHLHYRVKHGSGQWICVDHKGKVIKQESNVRRVSKMPLNAYRRNVEVLTPPEGKTLAELYALKTEALNQKEYDEITAKLNGQRIKNLTTAINKIENGDKGDDDKGDGDRGDGNGNGGIEGRRYDDDGGASGGTSEASGGALIPYGSQEEESFNNIRDLLNKGD